jgi:Tfp pilus assembly protein PilV
MPADGRPADRARRGFVIGELLIALLLLAVAVSSLAALMYSVSRRPTTRAETECVAPDAARGKCVPQTAAVNPEAKLLRSGCATRSVFDQRNCKDTVLTTDTTADGAVIKPRTDSAAMAILAKRRKEQSKSVRSDRGFLR